MSKNAKPFAVADAETDPFKFGQSVRPFLWGYYDGTIYRKFMSTEKFVEFARMRNVIIYAHNGGKFDWHHLDNHIDPGPVKIINGRLVEAHMGRATLRDSYSILPESLDRITGAKQKIDYRKFTAARRRHFMPEIEDYLRNDCVILWDALQRFFAEYGRGLTLAGATLRYWRKLGGEVPKLGYGPRDSAALFEQFQPFYHGGRCEALRPGAHRGKLYLLDINGAYAHAMTFDQWHGIPIEQKRVRAAHYERALFEIEADSDGAFPLRGDNELNFPHGRFRFHVTGRELAAALDLKLARNVKIITAHQFGQYTNLGAYVLHFEQERQRCKKAGDAVGATIAKLFRNGFYGKMAANPNHYNNYFLTELGGKPDKKTRADHPDVALCGTFTNRDVWSAPLHPWQKRFYDVTLGAQITGHVRSILLRALHEVRAPLYCDTDSIMCGHPGKLPLGDGLGQWKVEAIGSEAHIAGKKLYAFKLAGTRKYKIASKGAKLTASQIKRCVKGGEVIYRQPAQSYGLRGVRNIKRVIRRTRSKAV